MELFVFLPVAALLPVSACRLHGDRSHWRYRGCRQPRVSCRFWWSTVGCRPPDTTAGCKHHCLRCWGSGGTPLQKPAGTAGPGCTWFQAALWVRTGFFLEHPAGSRLWNQSQNSSLSQSHDLTFNLR